MFSLKRFNESRHNIQTVPFRGVGLCVHQPLNFFKGRLIIYLSFDRFNFPISV